MADTLENLADSSSYAVLQEKLDNLKTKYQVSVVHTVLNYKLIFILVHHLIMFESDVMDIVDMT